jgi:hypothetical protein
MIQGGIVSWRGVRKGAAMATVKARFDGCVFIPLLPVTLPADTLVDITVPDEYVSPWPPGNVSPEQRREWEELVQMLQAGESPFPTVEDAMRYLRKRK